ncbi:MAG: S8 family serine peptidase, partial [Phycisphaerales bacterium]|nr:S8 family serine peptidase [Phycisphaerales bacterium]
MRRHGIILTCAVIAGATLTPGSLAAPDPVAPRPAVVVEDAVIIQLDETGVRLMDLMGLPDLGLTGVPGLDTLGERFGVTEVREQFPGASVSDLDRGLPDLSGYHVVTFDPTLTTVDEVVAAYRAAAFVRSVEYIGIHRMDATPNDGSYPTQWHLNQANDKDIDAPEAWNTETGDPSIVVAVLDSGVRYYHKDLGGAAASSSNPAATDGNIWINLAEKNGAPGVDDDANGYVDDWVGYDFVTGATGCWSGEDCSGTDNDPRDFNGHGTHCAGNVAAINNNGYATASPAGGWGNGSLQNGGNGVKVMCLRMGYSGSSGGQEVGFVRMDFAASAFYYAANNGARIASCSWGSSNSGGIAAALDYFVGSGGLVFVAAGNANNQTAGYLNSRNDCYSVAATNTSDAKASFSSYGTWVDISAPGDGILSSYHVHSDPASDYVATLSGTSMATPLVASTAAATWSANPTWSAAQVWAQVRDTADNIDAQNPSYIGRLGSGRINLASAVAGGVPGCQNNGQCDDGDPCNGVETCVNGVCQPGAIVDCNGNGVADACDIASGTSQDCNSNGVPDECEGGNPCGGTGSTLLLVFTGSTSVPGVGTVQNEDIVAFDTGTGVYSLYFDGSDVGLGSFAINGLAVLPGGDLLMSFTAAGTIGGVSSDDSDILRFTPTSLGSNTAGSFSMYFDGSDVGLTSSSEDIDAIGFAPDGRLVISTVGNPGVSGLSGLADEDLIAFSATSLGSATAGSWSYYFDGSDVGLTNSSEDVDAVSILSSGLISLSTLGNFSVSGLSGAD